MTQMYSVAQFCKEHGISRSFLYKEWKAGRGPVRVKLGKRTLIPATAAEAWRAGLGSEQPAATRAA